MNFQHFFSTSTPEIRVLFYSLTTTMYVV